jgi:hypothetical protein
MKVKNISRIAAVVSLLTTTARKKWNALTVGVNQLTTALKPRLLSVAAIVFYMVILAVCFLPLLKELGLSDLWMTLMQRFKIY